MAFGRELNSCQHRYSKHNSCTYCGIYKHDNPALKSIAYAHPSHLNPKNFINHLRKRASKVVTPHELS
jgi:hypothetical protein